MSGRVRRLGEPALRWFVRNALPHAEGEVMRRLRREKRYRKLANYLWVQWLMARGSTRMWGGHPYWLTLDPSNFCQLQCPFCPTGANKGTRERSQMDFEHFRRFMDRVGPFVIRMELMNWGESLFNRRLPEMIVEAKRHGISLELHENFNHVPAEMIDGLVRSGLDVLSVSIDGLTQQTYEKYRIRGNLERVLSNLDALVQKRRELGSTTPRIVWQFLVFRHNEHELDRVEAFARARGVDEVRFVPPYLPATPDYLAAWMSRNPRFQAYPLPEAASSFEGPAPTPNKPLRSALALRTRRFRCPDLLRPLALRDLVAMIETPADAVRALARLGQVVRASLRPGLAAGSKVLRDMPGDTPGFCAWPWAAMAVNPNGSISPCCAIEDQADDFGNVFTEKWRSLWNGRRYRTARRHVSRYAAGKAVIQTDSDHPCVRCNMIGSITFHP